MSGRESLLPANTVRSSLVSTQWGPMRTKNSPHPRGVLGVWSPFGQAYAAHGEVMLKVGKKPTDPITQIPNGGGGPS